MNSPKNGAELLERLVEENDGRVFSKRGTKAQVNVLGNQISLAPPSVIPGRIPYPGQLLVPANTYAQGPILHAHAENPFSPEVMTVTLGQPIFDGFTQVSIASIPALDLRARIEWGCGGYSSVADIDYLSGSQIEVLGSFVRVTGLYAISFSGLVPPPSPTVQLAASVSYGPRPSSAHAPCWTWKTATLDPGVSETVIIPPFARDVTVFTTAANFGPFPAPSVIAFRDTNSHPTGVAAQAVGDVRTYPIPGQTFAVVVSTSGLSTTTTEFVLRFGLAL